jgi:hypothetical protein
MMRKCFGFTPVALVGLAGLALAGCETQKSRNPLSPTVAGPIAGVAITAPRPLEPANGHKVTLGQPVTLLFESAATTGERSVWMEVEFATDAAFQQKVHRADKVLPGPNGRSSYEVPTALQVSGKTYYWRVRGLDGANTGEYSAVANFEVVDPVVLDVPVPGAPGGNVRVDTLTPDLTVINGRATGPLAGPVVYRVELALDEGFGNLVAVLTAGRTGGSVTSVRPTPLQYATRYFWRVSASDGVLTTAHSRPESFQTPLAPAPPPAPTPAPAPAPGPTAPAPSNPAPTAPAPRPSGGNRAPDPAPGQRLPLPNMSSVVDEVARQYPGALRNSCQSHGGSWEFMDRLVDRLRQFDTRWGYNGKRGNSADPSHDVVAYNFGPGRDEGTTNVYIIDVIVGHCGNNPGGAWIDQTGETARQGSIGRWTGRGRF